MLILNLRLRDLRLECTDSKAIKNHPNWSKVEKKLAKKSGHFFESRHLWWLCRRSNFFFMIVFSSFQTNEVTASHDSSTSKHGSNTTGTRSVSTATKLNQQMGVLWPEIKVNQTLTLDYTIPSQCVFVNPKKSHFTVINLFVQFSNTVQAADSKASPFGP